MPAFTELGLKQIWSGFSAKLFLYYLLWLTRPAVLKNHLAKKKYPPVTVNKLNYRQGGVVRAATIQSRLALVQDVREYVDKMYQHTEDAVRQGAQLVVFPEDNAAHLLGLLPVISKLPTESTLDQALATLRDNPISIGEIFAYLTPVTKQVYFTLFQTLAKSFGVHIMGGSILISNEVWDKGSSRAPQQQVVNAAYLFAPTGQLVGRQLKAHLLPVEAEWGISCGCDLQVFDTPLGNLAFPVCMDATYFETFRILAHRGADIVLVPTANPAKYNFWKALRGTWPRVQETPVYGVTSTLIGEVLGIELSGRAAIYAPFELTPKGDGVLAQAPDPYQEAVVVANLDLSALQQYRQESQLWQRLNRKLIAKYLPELY
ncbi:MAG: nitrilase-related carbon-nitrogen hydrolase [Carboxydocellales bacterium]